MLNLCQKLDEKYDVIVFMINPEFRILRLTFHRNFKSAQNAEIGIL